MSQTTNHGENIANQVQTEDAYGDFSHLTDADVWNILDQIETHMMDTRNFGKDKIFDVLSKAKKALEKIDNDLPL